MNQDEFREAAWSVLANLDSAHLMWRNGRARGIVGATLDRWERSEPHVDWFPWASSRDKLECALTYIQVRRQVEKLILYCRMNDVNFFKRLGMYGVIRRVGTHHSFHEPGDQTAVWESRNAWD